MIMSVGGRGNAAPAGEYNGRIPTAQRIRRKELVPKDTQKLGGYNHAGEGRMGLWVRARSHTKGRA